MGHLTLVLQSLCLLSGDRWHTDVIIASVAMQQSAERHCTEEHTPKR